MTSFSFSRNVEAELDNTLMQKPKSPQFLKPSKHLGTRIRPCFMHNNCPASFLKLYFNNFGASRWMGHLNSHACHYTHTLPSHSKIFECNQAKHCTSVHNVQCTHTNNLAISDADEASLYSEIFCLWQQNNLLQHYSFPLS